MSFVRRAIGRVALTAAGTLPGQRSPSPSSDDEKRALIDRRVRQVGFRAIRTPPATRSPSPYADTTLYPYAYPPALYLREGSPDVPGVSCEELAAACFYACFPPYSSRSGLPS